MKRVITLTNWRRPGMYAQVLDALLNCEGIEDYRLINSIDPFGEFPAAFMILDQRHPLAQKIEITTVIAPIKLGCSGNSKRSLELAFEDKSQNFIIQLEDDTVPSKDFLKYMEFCDKTYQDDLEAFVVTGFNRRLIGDPKSSEIRHVGKRKSPTAYLAWGTWRRIWDEVYPQWFSMHWAYGYKHPDNPRYAPEGDEFLKVIRKVPDDDGSWGYPWLKYFPKGRYEVFPAISRCRDIGSVDGRFNPSPEWHKANVWTPIWAGDEVPASYEALPGIQSWGLEGMSV